MIGIGVEPSFDVKLPFRVKIDAGDVGGPVGRARRSRST